jgi:phage terminase small subunit
MTDDAISGGTPLHPKHERFVQAYLASRNATAAARAAGYREESAAACGSRLLRRDDIRAALAQREDPTRRQTGSRAARTYLRLRPKHRAFLDAYFRSGNAAQAAVAAGYSETSARHTGCRLRQRADVSAALSALQEWLAAECEAMAAEIVAAFRRILGPHATHHVSVDGDGALVLEFANLTRQQAAALCELVGR